VLREGTQYAGYQWRVTFIGNRGNQPALRVDAEHLTSNATATDGTVIAMVDDGDNSIASDGRKASYAMPGEAPAGYHRHFVPATTTSFTASFSYTISGLTPGLTYFASVAAVNAFGVGVAALPSPAASISPSAQPPQPPTNVTLTVNAGSATTLNVSYLAPLSDGGKGVLKYRVDLADNSDFLNAFYTDVPCPASQSYSIFKVKTTSASASTSDPIISGSFQLNVSFNGSVYVTTAIPYNAPAMLVDEEGEYIQIGATSSSSYNNFTATVYKGQAKINFSVVAEHLIFRGDVVRLSVSRYSEEVFEVVRVNGTEVTLSRAVYVHTNSTTSSSTSGTVSTTTSAVYRLVGGRGSELTSRVLCSSADDVDLCPLSRVSLSGSMQGKIQQAVEAASAGLLSVSVSVDRDGPDESNGYTWRVTFLDIADPETGNFNLGVFSNDLVTGSSNGYGDSGTGNVTVSKLSDGFSYGACAGTAITIPADGKALLTGQLYYARISAVNSLGYSVPAPTHNSSSSSSSFPSAKPMVAPGAPTLVAVSVVSATSLRVAFHPPLTNGGDAVSSYKIEYTTLTNFNSGGAIFTVNVTHLSLGPPYVKTLSGLQRGVVYYVRVSARNSQGYGDPAQSAPAYIHTYEHSAAPTGLRLWATADSLLTVSFGSPLDDGGDAVTAYQVEWDTSSAFASVLPPPNKGAATLDIASSAALTEYSVVLTSSSTSASTSTPSTYSYTIQSLTVGVEYYVRVSAINQAGTGTSTSASTISGTSSGSGSGTTVSPSFSHSVAPAYRVPGRPHTISASSGDALGTIRVSWQRPFVPAHDTPCYSITSTTTSTYTTTTTARLKACPTPYVSASSDTTSTTTSTLTLSDGGLDILEYLVEYNESADFSGPDGGTAATSNT
jgi:hypothetical protein